MNARILIKLLIIINATLLCDSVKAYDFEDTGLYFNVLSEKDRTAEVTYNLDFFGNGSSGIYIPEYAYNPINKTNYKVIAIGDSAFYGCNFNEWTIPNTISRIGEKAFYGCTFNDNTEKAKPLVIPNSVVFIGDSAFWNCAKLYDVVLPSSVVDMAKTAFRFIDFRFAVADDNPSYASIDGALYSKDFTQLISCPKMLESITLPENLLEIGDYAFYCSQITEIDLPQSLERVGDYAFSDTKIESIVIPSSIKVLGKGVFSDSDISEIKLPSTLKEIPERFFEDCHNLKTVDIPYSVLKICKLAFCDTGLTEITIPNSVREIGDLAFHFSRQLTTINIPASVTFIGSGAFSNFGASATEGFISHLASIEVDPANTFYTSKDGVLYTKDLKKLVACPPGKTSVEIANTVTEIEKQAFLGCNRLQSIVIPDNVTRIGASAFESCKLMTEVKMSKSIEYIDSAAFNDCLQVVAPIDLPATLIEIGPDAFCCNFEYINCHASIPPKIYENTFESHNYKNIPIYVPFGYKESYRSAPYWRDFQVIEELRGLNYRVISEDDGIVEVIRHPDYAYEGDILIPDKVMLYDNNDYKNYTVVAIADSAFYDNSALTSVIMPNSIKRIGNYAFSGCYNLTSVNIPAMLAKLGVGAFEYCDITTPVKLPETLTEIADNTFCGNNNLISVEIPNSIVRIGDNAFGGCGLRELNIPNSVEYIGKYAFSTNIELSSIYIPSSVTFIGGGAFSGVSTSVSNLSRIEVAASNPYYTSVDGVVYTKDLTKLVAYPPGSTSIEILESTTEINEAACAGCVKVVSVDIPDKVTIIGRGAFCYCKELEEVELSKSLSSIGELAFYDSYLKSMKTIDFPSSLQEIGSKAFLNISFYTITCRAVVPPTICEDTFSDYAYESSFLYVMDGCKEIYGFAPYWNRFLNIEENSLSGLPQVGIGGNENLSVMVDGNTIIINGTGKDDFIEVYSISGQCVYKGRDKVIKHLPGGVYVVKQNDKKTKVKL